MKLAIIVLVVIVVLIAVVSLYFMQKGPDLSQFEPLKEPKISPMKNQKMLVVEARGDPNVVGGKAFSLLFKIYFKIKGASKGPKQPPPRARWPMPLDTPKGEWIGYYAMPVPEKTIELPEYKAEPGLTVSLTTWEYGPVAEILHLGPYNEEEPTIKRLVDFITEQGYESLGDHEEEYIKGPTMFSKGNPEEYVTIIRYRVKKVAQL